MKSKTLLALGTYASGVLSVVTLAFSGFAAVCLMFLTAFCATKLK